MNTKTLRHDIEITVGYIRYSWDTKRKLWFNVDFGINKSARLVYLVRHVEELHKTYNRKLNELNLDTTNDLESEWLLG